MTPQLMRWTLSSSVAIGAVSIYFLAFAYFAPATLFSTGRVLLLVCLAGMFAGFAVRRPSDTRKLLLMGAIVSAVFTAIFLVCATLLEGAPLTLLMIAACIPMFVVLLGGVVTTRLFVTIGSRKKAE